MTRFDEAFKEEVRSRTDIVDLVSEYVRLERRGNRYVGLCPFHSEKTPSFNVVPDGQFYHCFGCKASGDVFSFLMQKERMTFPEAVAFLARRAGIRLPEKERTPAQEAAAQERAQVLAALEFAARFYQYQLDHTRPGEEARAYLAGRGLTPETMQRFRLGYAPPDWDALYRAARARFPAEVLVKAGLVRSRRQGDGYYDLFRHRIMFPIRDIRGRVVGFGGRALAPDQSPKYLNSPEGPYFNKRLHLYALDLAREAMRGEDMGIIVEGYMDAIALHQAGFPMAVASLGTSLTDEQAQLLRRQCTRVVIAYDADVAGQAATLRGLDRLVQAGCDVRVLRLPAGKDPDELVRTQGPEAFRRALAEAVPLTEFQIQRVLEAHKGAGNAAEAKARAVRDLIPLLVELREFAVLQDEYIKKVAQTLDVTEEFLRIEVKRHLDKLEKSALSPYTRTGNWNNTKVLGRTVPGAKGTPATGAPPRYTPVPGGLPDPRQREERTLLRLLVHHPHLWGQMPDLGQHRWSRPEHADLFRALKSVGSGGEERVARAMGMLESPAARSLLAELQGEAALVQHPERELSDVLRRLEQETMEQRKKELERIFRELEAAGQSPDPALIQEFAELARRTRR